MTKDEQELAARAKWCRRLAGDAADEQLKASLNELARELEGRARGTAQPEGGGAGDNIQ